MKNTKKMWRQEGHLRLLCFSNDFSLATLFCSLSPFLSPLFSSLSLSCVLLAGDGHEYAIGKFDLEDEDENEPDEAVVEQGDGRDLLTLANLLDVRLLRRDS